MRYARRLIVSVLLILLADAETSPAAAQLGCGLPPIPPIPPVGCRELIPRCICDQSGRICWWEWVCVR